MNLTSYFKAEEVERVVSEVNGEIVVVGSEGEIRFLVNGLTESGRYIDQIWNKPLGYLKKKKFSPKSCLVLGLGGGTAARLVRKNWEGINIVGVEIDPVMVELGGKYLGLKEISGLEVNIGDAMDFIATTEKSYDLILVDTFLGEEAIHGRQRLENFWRILLPGGVIVFNFLIYKEVLKKEAERFLEQLNNDEVKLLRELTNLLVVVKRQSQNF